MTEQPRATETPRVVSVEDNPGDMRLIEEGVAAVDSDIELVQYSNGTEALAALTEPEERLCDRVDFLLLDMNVPGKSGLDILRRIREDEPADDLPIVLLSSSQNSEDIRRGYESGANAYITKPTDPDEFIRRIVAAIRFWLPLTETDS